MGSFERDVSSAVALHSRAHGGGCEFDCPRNTIMVVVDVRSDAGRVRSVLSRKQGYHGSFFIQEYGYWKVSEGCIVLSGQHVDNNGKNQDEITTLLRSVFY